VAAYLPGAWLPHCVLASTEPAEAVHRAAPGRAGAGTVVGVEIADARSGEIVAVH
jgi:hypothetical protein